MDPGEGPPPHVNRPHPPTSHPLQHPPPPHTPAPPFIKLYSMVLLSVVGLLQTNLMTGIAKWITEELHLYYLRKFGEPGQGEPPSGPWGSGAPSPHYLTLRPQGGQLIAITDKHGRRLDSTKNRQEWKASFLCCHKTGGVSWWFGVRRYGLKCGKLGGWVDGRG